MKLRVVAYNILKGLHSVEKDRPITPDPVRMEASKAVVASLKPDILMLTEVCMPDYNDHGIDIDHRELFGLPHQIDRGPSKGSSHGNAILSRFPMNEGTNYSGGVFKHVRAIITQDIRPITLDLIHPGVFMKESHRAARVSRLAGMNRRGYILAGDFNAYSRDDTYDLEKTISTYQKFSSYPEGAEAFVTDFLTGQTIDIVKASGMRDTYRMFHSGKQQRTVPTRLREGGDEGARVDYIFCSPDIQVHAAGIYATDPATTASDHFPIWADIEI